MKTTTTQTETEILPYAIATAGEQARDWAYDQIAKFRPHGANYRRLRALQNAGEALTRQPQLYAAAPELRDAAELVQRAWSGDGADMATAVDAILLALTKANTVTLPE